jgi:Ca2+/Na+ antiporter
MESSTVAWIGAIAGGSIGILGGIFGTWCSIRRARGPRERAVIINSALAFWFFISLFVAGMFLLPDHIRPWLWLPYGPLLAWAIVVTNRRQAQARAEDGAGSPSSENAAPRVESTEVTEPGKSGRAVGGAKEAADALAC